MRRLKRLGARANAGSGKGRTQAGHAGGNGSVKRNEPSPQELDRQQRLEEVGS
ncbi:MAG: hypothetical protein IT428_28155 [Planctomycetaceae bacterium]|nr:hypothetical protein [Planctomycetaceae bacterium]